MQQLNPSEISDLIKDRIESLDIASQPRNEGSIVSVSDGIIRVHGLAAARYGEMIEFPGGVYGMALNLERDSVGVVVLGDYEDLSEGMTARCTERILEVPVGPGLLGRVVDELRLPDPLQGGGGDEVRQRAPFRGRRLPQLIVCILLQSQGHGPGHALLPPANSAASASCGVVHRAM